MKKPANIVAYIWQLFYPSLLKNKQIMVTVKSTRQTLCNKLVVLLTLYSWT